MSSLTQEGLTAAGKATPAIAVAGTTLSGVSLQDWVLIATLIYTVLQTVHLIYRFFRDSDREDPDAE